jgi:RNA polymerase sigma-70 factor, ECF subfamily
MQLGQVVRATDGDLAVEQQLVALAAVDPDAFGRLYDRYVERVYRFAFGRLGTHIDAEDVTSQTFRRALEGLAGYTWQGAPFGAWLFRIAHNQIVDRRRQVASPLSLSLERLGEAGFEPRDDDSAPPDQQLLDREEIDAAWAAVDTLPALQRRAVALRFGRDLSHAEVGSLIGRSEAATKQLIYRAMKTLRVQLNQFKQLEATQ